MDGSWERERGTWDDGMVDIVALVLVFGIIS